MSNFIKLFRLAELVKRPNTTGCEPAIHEFESRIPPHLVKNDIVDLCLFFLKNLLLIRFPSRQEV